MFHVAIVGGRINYFFRGRRPPLLDAISKAGSLGKEPPKLAVKSGSVQ